MSMLLSYYDVYWNDDFIPNDYQANAFCTLSSLDDTIGDYSSPGVDDIFISLSSYLTDEESQRNCLPSYDFLCWKENQILNYMQANIDSGSFLGKLFSTTKECGYYLRHTDSSNFTLGLGVNYDIERNTLSQYIADNPQLVGKVTLLTNQYIKGKNTLESIRNEIISELTKGKPVIVGGDFITGYDENHEAVTGGDMFALPMTMIRCLTKSLVI